MFDVYSGSNISLALLTNSFQNCFVFEFFTNQLQILAPDSWLDKFKLKEGPENWSSGAFETDDFD